MSIELNFGLFWSGSPLSYLRFLTFKSLRHFHPNSKISLFISDNFSKSGYAWRDEKQDFENDNISKDYIPELKSLDVEINKIDLFSQYVPSYQSDFFRWWWLKENSGFYLDTDQIILKSFEALPLDNNLIFSAYMAKSCGLYSPVGVIGADNSEMVEWIDKLLPQFKDFKNYNSLGPFMFRTMLQMRKWNDKMFNAPSNYFYPIPDSFMVPYIYDGKLQLSGDEYALHLFMGHPISQEFNNKYTEDFAKTSSDTASRFLRENNII